MWSTKETFPAQFSTGACSDLMAVNFGWFHFQCLHTNQDQEVRVSCLIYIVMCWDIKCL